MTALNPFAQLTRDIAKKVLADHRAKLLAQRRLEKLLTAYEEMAQDPRYRAIRDELTLILGDYLRDLVESAQACPRCASKASKITLLQQVVAEPLEEVWFARQQEALPSGEPEDAQEVMDVGG